MIQCQIITNEVAVRKCQTDNKKKKICKISTFWGAEVCGEGRNSYRIHAAK